MKKIAIYDRYLSTAGGGERYSCKMAEILSGVSGYRIHLVTDLFADLEDISDKLNLDLSGVELRVFPYISDDYTKRLTEEYDLFINATYLSALSSCGEKSIYLCYFPTPFDVDFSLLHRFLLIFFRLPAIWLLKLASRLTAGFSEVEIQEGIYEPKRFMLRRGSWISGEASLIIKSADGFRLGIKNPASSLLEDMNIEVVVSDINKDDTNPGKQVFRYETVLKKGMKETVTPEFTRHEGKYRVTIISDTFTSARGRKGSADSRRLGAAVYNESRKGIIKKILLKSIGYIPLFLVTFPKNLRFLDSYQRILSISEYSNSWIKKLWRKDSTILFPPVDTLSFALGKGYLKEKAILSVGRFFPEHHNKKQYELAKTFIKMLAGFPEDMKGYTLYLAGGVADRPEHMEYVEKIKDMVRGYPVEVLVNTPFEELAGLFKKASIFWHAAGLGEDEGSHPEKFEHFGITTVEAMSAGCIPVVIGKGGQKEIVSDGVDGFLFKDLEELSNSTLEIIRGRGDQDILKRNAISSSQRFSNENFARDLLSIVEGVLENT